MLRNQARSAQTQGKTQLCPTWHPVKGGHGWGFIIHPNRASTTSGNRILILLLARLSMRHHVVWSKRMLTHSEWQRNPNQKEKRRSKNNEAGSCGRPPPPFSFHVVVSFKGSILYILEVFTVFWGTVQLLIYFIKNLWRFLFFSNAHLPKKVYSKSLKYSFPVYSFPCIIGYFLDTTLFFLAQFKHLCYRNVLSRIRVHYLHTVIQYYIFVTQGDIFVN